LHSHPSKPKTLFATHYHELNELEEKLEGVKNFHIAIKEHGNQIIFLRILKPGGSEHSFGIHVAQMAGIPNQVILRSSEILASLEQNRTKSAHRKTLAQTAAKPVYQMNMFQTEDPITQEIKRTLLDLDLNSVSPIDALLKLQQLKLLVKPQN
jgi:DNA mismatch repair protein MutS